MNLTTHRRLGTRPSIAGNRRRRCPLEVGLLEGRLMLAADVTAPVTVAQVIPNTLNGTGYYTASPETVNLLASDPDSPSGLTTFYSLDNAGFVPGNSLQVGDGNHTLQFFSVDQSGNREAIQTLALNIDSTAPVVTATASPNSLWPPNHKLVPVTVSGHVADASGGVPGTIRYTVTDEYNPSHPRTGTADVDPNGNYAFVVPLQASRRGQDRDGRQYTIVVSAIDQAGNTGSATAFVVVPHDQGRHAGRGKTDDGQDTGDHNGRGPESRDDRAPGNGGQRAGKGNDGNSKPGKENRGRGRKGDSTPQTVVAVPPSPSSRLTQGDATVPVDNGNHGQGDNGHEDNGNHGQSNNGHEDNGNHGQDNNGNEDNGNGKSNGKGRGGD